MGSRAPASQILQNVRERHGVRKVRRHMSADEREEQLQMVSRIIMGDKNYFNSVRTCAHVNKYTHHTHTHMHTH